MRGLTTLLRCEKGVTAIEYGLIVSLIALAALAAFVSIGSKVATMYNNVANQMPSN